MRMTRCFPALSIGAALLAGAGSALFGVCGPFTDTANDSFCPFVLEVFYTGITTGTTPATYDPSANVTRLQMAAFLSRTVDSALGRASRPAALKKFWTTQGEASLGLTTVSDSPVDVASDGLDLWVSSAANVSRVRASDGRLLETWTGAANGQGTLSAMGKILVAALLTPGKLYRINPGQPAGEVTTVSTTLGTRPVGIAFDGSRIWTANIGDGTPGTGSVSIVTPGATIPWTVTNVSLGFSQPGAALWDGATMWVTDKNLNQLMKLDSNGAIVQAVETGNLPEQPVFDGTNIFVPSFNSDTVLVIRASTAATLATLTGNGMNGPTAAAFDGRRILVTNYPADSVSLWKAADLTPLGSFSMGANSRPGGACSDGINFWIALAASDKLARF